ncbi:MAG: hypothetical protein ISS69_11580 [Phycisphaerae bacterium]|nr:hypothetical protein [Planctomycetota bacterium]MBL7220747.1 hypothetical protein [Phycisphaerae bacterium]
MTARPRDDQKKPVPPEPVDISNGIPDCRASVSWPVIVVLIAVFAGWCAFLLYCQYGGRL